MYSSRVFLPVFLLMFALAGCDCSDTGTNATTAGGDGGATTGDGGSTNGDGGSTNGDGGSTNGDGGSTNDGGGGTNGDGGGGDPDAGVDGGMNCDPLEAAQACPGKCGYVSNGCSGVIDCDAPGNGGQACTTLQTCGAGNVCVDNVVDAGTCTPTDCATLGHTCGEVPDGCNGVLNCWPSGTSACPNAAQACIPNATTGALSCVMGTQGCQGSLCNNLPTSCAVSAPTRLTGTVVTPGIDPEGDGSFINRFPVPNAVVYIPADPATPLPAIYEGVDPNDSASCGRCADEQFVLGSQSVLAAGITDYRGAFTLSGRIPVGVPFNLVIKVGKWRRVVAVPAGVSTECQTVSLATQYTRLNATSNDGAAGTWLPHIAIGTGEVDEMECVLRNAGIADSEFSLPSGNGRIHMYRMDGAQMGTCNGNTTWGGVAHACRESRLATNYGPSMLIPNYGCVDGRSGCSWAPASTNASNLYGSLATMQNYDAIIWDCEGDEVQYDAAEPSMEQYVNTGGRMFASHFAYTWIENNGSLDASADWGDSQFEAQDTGYVSLPTGTTARPRANPVKSLQFRDWLDWQGALIGSVANVLDNPVPPAFTIADPRDRARAVPGPSTDEWLFRTTNTSVCNNDTSVLCSSDADCSGSYCRFYRCSNDSSRACSSNAGCLNGGTCTTPSSFYRNGYCSHDETVRCNVNSDCGSGRTCLTVAVQQLSFNTPYGASDANICGRVAYTGFHVSLTDNNDTSDVFPNVCLNDGSLGFTAQELSLLYMLFDLNACVSAGDPVTPPQCTPDTVDTLCPAPNDACGFLSNGCGSVVDCGGCSAGNYCDVNVCRPIPMCTAQTCTSLGYVCGQHPDGCGGIADNAMGNDTGCGGCPPTFSCGPDGLCMMGGCTPDTGACGNRQCGTVSDGCGGVLPCGTCGPLEACVEGYCYAIE